MLAFGAPSRIIVVVLDDQADVMLAGTPEFVVQGFTVTTGFHNRSHGVATSGAFRRLIAPL
jgi:hypothetical protein